MKIKKSIMILSIMLLVVTSAVLGDSDIVLKAVGTYKTGIFDDGAAEIVSYDPGTQQLFVVNGAQATIDVINISDPSKPVLTGAIDLTPYGKQANSVAVKDGLVAAAVENTNKQAPGCVAFFRTDGTFINKLMIGALPDMITFSPDGQWVIVANEGEPNDDYTVDPEGSVSIINVAHGVDGLSDADVATADFTSFNGTVLPESVRVYGPGSTAAMDMEPEYITVSKDSKTAYVTLQENNALAIVDIASATVTKIVGLGYKDHMDPWNCFDASNEDGGINFKNWPVLGMYQPDSLAAYTYKGQTYIITANEGDSRDYPGYSEELRVKDVVLDPIAFPDAAILQDSAGLGRLKISSVGGDTDGDGDYDRLYSYGGRSFSIWNGDGELVFDSKSFIELIVAYVYPLYFNADSDDNGSFDSRSDDKGPEPEGLAIGEVDGKTYAFIGLERVGGIMVFDITVPFRPGFVQYINTRDFTGNCALGTAGDLAPEGFLFISEEDSPVEKPLLVVSYEVSGTTTVYEIDEE